MKKQTQGVSDKTGSKLLTEIYILKSYKNSEGMKSVTLFFYEKKCDKNLSRWTKMQRQESPFPQILVQRKMKVIAR